MTPIPYTQLAPIYDFTQIETAFQQFLCGIPQSPFVVPADGIDINGGLVPVYTASNIDLQSYRPRIWLLLHSINEMEHAHVLTVDNVLRASGWRAQMKIGLVTKPDYGIHAQWRSAILALVPSVQPQIIADGSGLLTQINANLQYHEVGTFQMQNAHTTITPHEGDFRSDISINLTFSVKSTAWPGGTLN